MSMVNLFTYLRVWVKHKLFHKLHQPRNREGFSEELLIMKVFHYEQFEYIS